MRARGPFKRVLRRLTPRGAYRYVIECRDRASTAKRALAYAKQDIGYTEDPPGSNMTKFGAEWDQNGVAWCGMAVASWWRRAGFRVNRELALQIDYVPVLVGLAQQFKHGLFIVGKRRVAEGDAVALNFPGGESADHVEMFDRWIDKRRGDFATVGGNTSKAGSQSNGGMVCAQIRNTGQVVAFVRIGRVVL